MTRPICYLLCALIYDVSLLGASEFFWLDFALAFSAFVFLQKQKKHLLKWLLMLNIFLLFIVVSYILNGENDLAIRSFIRTNLILVFILSLFLGRNQYFIIQAFSTLKFPQKLLAIMLISSKLFSEILLEISKMPRVLKARGVALRPSLLTYKAYASLIGKMIVFSLDRSFEIYLAMGVRGYRGRLVFLSAQSASLLEICLLIGVILLAIFRIFRGF